MESSRPSADPRDPADEPGEARPSVARRRQGAQTAAQEKARLSDAKAGADAIARAAPCSAWPRDLLLGRAAAASLASHRSGTPLFVTGQRCDKVAMIVQGKVVSSVSSDASRSRIVSVATGELRG